MLVFSNPSSGVATDLDASLSLTGSGDHPGPANDEPDAFGFSIQTGDIDGDGLTDLVVGSPRDPTMGVDAGSVHLFFGASGTLL